MIVEVFGKIVGALGVCLAPGVDVALREVVFLGNFLAGTMGNFLHFFTELVEAQAPRELVQLLGWMVEATYHLDEENLQAIASYWCFLAQRLYAEQNAQSVPFGGLYSEVVSPLRTALAHRLVAPWEIEEMLDDDLDVPVMALRSRKSFGDLYRTMSDALVCLGHVDERGTRQLIAELRGGASTSPEAAVRFCHVFGAVVRVLSEQYDAALVREVIQEMATLAVSAPVLCPAIAFVCGSVTSFLTHDNGLLADVVTWLVGQLTADAEEQHLAALAALKEIAARCRDQIVKRVGGGYSLLESMLVELPTLMQKLAQRSVLAFLDVLGDILLETPLDTRAVILARIAGVVNGELRGLLRPPFDMERVGRLRFILLCNRSLCSSATSFLAVFPYLEEVVGYYELALGSGEAAAAKSVLLLLDRIVSATVSGREVLGQMLPVVVQRVMPSFANTQPERRCPQVLRVVATTIGRAAREMAAVFEQIRVGLYEETLAMLHVEPNPFSDQLRKEFLTLVRALVLKLWECVVALGAAEVARLVEELSWLAAYPANEVAEQAISVLGVLVGVPDGESRADFAATFGPLLLAVAVKIVADPQRKGVFHTSTSLLFQILKLPIVWGSALVGEVMARLVDTFPNRDPNTLGEFVVAVAQRAQAGGISEVQRTCRDFVVMTRNLLRFDPDFFAAERLRATEALTAALGTITARVDEGVDARPMELDSDGGHEPSRVSWLAGL